jgi:signal transduction histidine kinase/ActR/RegA family two-component response regulator
MTGKAQETTPGGVPGLGDIAWGSHFCHFYDTGDELADILVPFFKAGIDHNEACLWVTSEPFPTQLAREALQAAVPDLAARESKGQIAIIDHQEWYRRSAGQSAEQTLDGWKEREQRALANGYRGLRLTGNTCWLEREDWDSFSEYESMVCEAFHGRRIVGLCSYCISRCRPSDVLDVIGNHQFTLTRRGEQWDVLESAALRAARADLLRIQAAMNREHEIAERLREAEANHREAARRKDEFLAMLGHELRNPLAPISTALQVLRLQSAGQQFKREFQVVERQVDHLSSLVDDLLDVSRITQGKLDLHPEALELADAVAAGVEIASPMLERAQQVLHVDVSPNGLPVYGDRKRIAQILSNLLTNASKHSPQHSEISVSARRDGDSIALKVKDQGRGIAPELLPQIFELFVQSSQASDRAGGGLGLGLAIVRSLVDMHEGSVDVTSKLGEGSEFTIRLPANSTAAAVPTPRDDVYAGSPTARRVLIVDDNIDALEMMAELVRLLGFEVRTSEDAPKAMQEAENFRPDVALLDIGLPVVDGYQLGQQLRTFLPDLHLCAITGYGQSSDRQRSREAGFQNHLVKPISLAQLQNVFASVPAEYQLSH